MWHRRWFKKGLLFALVPIGALGAYSCHRGHGHHNLSEAQVQERLKDGAEDLVDYVDGTDEQTQKIQAIAGAAATDMMTYREEHKTLRNEFQQALSAPDIDRDQLEGLRVNALDLADRASARLVSAIADIAEVLNVNQRQKLISKWKRYQH